MHFHFGWIPVCLALAGPVLGQEPLAGTTPLEEATGDARSAAMVADIDQFASRLIQEAEGKRAAFWKRDLSSAKAYEASVEPQRARLATILGVNKLDVRMPMAGLEYLSSSVHELRLAEAAKYVVHAVRWPVLDGVNGEGIYLKQRGEATACIVLLPDADQTPEELAGLVEGKEVLGQAAHELALAGCDVVIPALINRQSDFSGNPELGLRTNQSHREWIYRQTFELGRNVGGYELHKVLALVEWLNARKVPVGVAGYGEGGRLALMAAALDKRIDATLVSGAWEELEATWQRPLERNGFGLVKEFGEAEIASLVMPRPLIIAHGQYPVLPAPVELAAGVRKNAAPGGLATPDEDAVRKGIKRVRQLAGDKLTEHLRLVIADEGELAIFPVEAVGWLRKALRLGKLDAPSELRIRRGSLPDDRARQQRLVNELVDRARRALQVCERQRNTLVWKQLATAKTDAERSSTTAKLRESFWEESIGRLPDPAGPPAARSRVLDQNSEFVTHEVMMEVWPGVPAWGYLIVPKGIKEGERRPVVVCQHGLEGLPEDVVNEAPSAKAYGAYKGFAATLARKGYVTFAPHNFYRGKDHFRVIQRKLNLVGLSLFSVIIGQHQQTLAWLKTQPFVDGDRIAFYGLSYGGKSAMRIPAVLPDYCLSICSGDFNEWVRKCATVDLPLSYVYSGEYEIWEWDLGNTFNYAEMAALIAPRPFMVERGHDDGVGLDEWVAYEYAKVFRYYNKLGLGEKSRIEYFNGPHTIHGVGTFEFLERHLGAGNR
jgi:dienelactone hydrolase